MLSFQDGVFAAGTISLTGAYTQDFNTLALTGTSNTIVPNGWDFNETGSNADSTYRAGSGTAATGDTYSFGSDADTDRAFGGLFSGTLNPTIGANFQNNTGTTISALEISYTGEQWRLGSEGRADRLDFQYSTNASSLATGTWIDYNALDFSSPTTISTGAKDGNLPQNRTAVSATISGLAIPNGASFWIRWQDFNASGSDDGLAIDDFSLTPHGAAPVVSSIVRSDANPTNAASVNFTVTFSSAVTGVDSTDFNLFSSGVTGATITSVSGGGSAYTVAVGTGSGDGTLRLDVVDDDTILDVSTSIPLGGAGSGNGNFNSGQVYSIDKSAPSVAIASSAPNPTNTTPIPVTFTFSEPVTGFTAGDVSVTNGTLNSFSGSGSMYTANLIPSNGIVSVNVAASVAVDSAGNGNTAAPQFSITFDNIRPSVTVNQAAGQADPTASSPINFTAVFNEPVNIASFTAGDVSLGGSASPTSAVITEIAPNDGTTFNIAVSGMGAAGTVTVSLPAGGVFDPAGNSNTASTSGDHTVTYDNVAPVVSSILRANNNPTSKVSVAFNVIFSKPVIGVDSGDFALNTTGITGASVTDVSGSGDTYAVAVGTGIGSGTIRLDVVDNGTIVDSAANPLGGAGDGSYYSGETYTIDKSAQGTDPGIIVNEASNGASGAKEWIELVVVGSTPTVNLTGWIIDDNNGDFDSFMAGKGIASGHMRFASPMPACASGTSLAAAPVGARIIVYNANDVDVGLGAYPNDPCDSDGDGVYYLPVGAVPNQTSYLQLCSDQPRISPLPAIPDYGGCVYSSPALTWDSLSLLNTGDAVQTRRPDGLFFHGFAYGNLTTPPVPSFPNGDVSFNVNSSTGLNMSYQFNCGNYFSNGGGQFVRSHAGTATPGSVNNLSNAAFVRALELGTFNFSDLNDVENCRVEPEVDMAFLQAQVEPNQPAQLSITLRNPYESLDGFSLDLLGVQFTNSLPAGLALSGANPVSNTCGGIFTGADGATSFSLSGVALPTLSAPASPDCTLVVNVSAAAAGSYTSSLAAGEVSSATLGVSGGSNLTPASASLLVVAGSNNNLPDTLPATGFAPGRTTLLPDQPLDKTYTDMNEITIEIPSIHVKTTVVGIPVSDNEWDLSWLGEHAGWLNGTAFPTRPGNSVITAHVWDALNKPGPFMHLSQLAYGDRVILRAWGQSYVYEVRAVNEHVNPNDTSALGHEDFPWLTLVTCKDYNASSDGYDWRVVVRAVQVSVE